MNIWNILKNCSGAVNKVALLSTCAVAGLAGLNLYNYATTRPAKRAERIYNLASMLKSGHTPDEYAKIRKQNNKPFQSFPLQIDCSNQLI